MSNKTLGILFILTILASGILAWQMYHLRIEADKLVSVCIEQSTQETK